MALHKTGCDLLALAIKVQEQMPRGVKRSLGEKINVHSIEMLDLMALANATKGDERAACIEQLLKLQRTLTVLLRVAHDAKYIPHKLWGSSVQLLDSIGRQGGGWLKSSRKAPAA